MDSQTEATEPEKSTCAEKPTDAKDEGSDSNSETSDQSKSDSNSSDEERECAAKRPLWSQRVAEGEGGVQGEHCFCNLQFVHFTLFVYLWWSPMILVRFTEQRVSVHPGVFAVMHQVCRLKQLSLWFKHVSSRCICHVLCWMKRDCLPFNTVGKHIVHFVISCFKTNKRKNGFNVCFSSQWSFKWPQTRWLLHSAL